jgi:hypothetical protein
LNVFLKNGIVEKWNVGMLGIKAEVKHYNCEKLLQTHYSITPLFHHSNWGEAPNFDGLVRKRGGFRP